MKGRKVQTESNCIPTPAGCVQWWEGDIEYLGICDGDFLPKIIWEIVGKLEDIAGEDISEFDIDGLLEVCNKKALKETTLISILELLRDNQICLKDYIIQLEKTIAELSKNSGTNVALKCFAEFDSQGNSLGLTREQLDQLVIDKLCDHKARIEFLEGKVVSMQNQIDDLSVNATVAEPEFETCLQIGEASTSSHVKLAAEEICDLRDEIGVTADITTAMGKIPDLWSSTEWAALLLKYEITGWITNPANLAQMNNNLLLAWTLSQKQITEILTTCCAPSCDAIKLGFTASFNTEDGVLMTLSFTRSAGTFIPSGFEDGGSLITVTDKEGVSVSYLTNSTTPIETGEDIDIDITGLSTGRLLVTIKTLFLLKGTDGSTIMTCQDCVSQEVNYVNDACCAITNTGDEPVVITLKTCSS